MVLLHFWFPQTRPVDVAIGRLRQQGEASIERLESAFSGETEELSRIAEPSLSAESLGILPVTARRFGEVSNIHSIFPPVSIAGLQLECVNTSAFTISLAASPRIGKRGIKGGSRTPSNPMLAEVHGRAGKALLPAQLLPQSIVRS